MRTFCTSLQQVFSFIAEILKDLLSVLPQKFSNFFSNPLFTLYAERFCFSDMNLILSLPVILYLLVLYSTYSVSNAMGR